MVAAAMDLDAAEALVVEHGAERVTQALGPFLTEARRTRIEGVLDGRMATVHVAIEAPSDPRNAAAVVRTCEALGAMDVHVIAAEARALCSRDVTQGSFHWVRTHHHERIEEFLALARLRGVRLYGACMDGGEPVTRLGVDEPFCLMFGNEQRGLSVTARRACDALFHVPMVGMSESLNLSVAAAISLFEMLRRKRTDGLQGDLDASARDSLRASYYLGSVDPRLVQGLLRPQPSTEAHDPR
jgi:tRNA (guanosine-2'-O-)-methyltransferase